MINLQIDTSSLAEAFNLDSQSIDSLLDYTVKEITARFAAQWEQEAMSSLHSSREQYVRSLVVVDEGFAKGAVVLTGILPNMIESGAPGWDMKPAFLNGPNAKRGKDGSKYNSIPFSFGTPGSLSGATLPKEIYDIVRKKPTNQPIVKDDLKSTPASLKTPQKKSIRMPESQSFKEYQHKSSIYEGVSKRTDSVTGQSSYGSFRRVSDKSDPSSWIHPGFEAANLAEKALETFDIPRETGMVIDQWLEKL